MVGGCVRDFLLRMPLHDFDVEVFNLSFDSLFTLLSEFGSCKQVGKAFGVIKLAIPGYQLDFSLPRTETKIAQGHTGFTVLSDPFLTFTQAASRRDFAVNSIGFDPGTGEYLDPFGGILDLQSKVLKHTSSAFSEDPLRVLRAMQLAARLEFAVAPDTLALCKTLPLGELPKERLFEEFKKLLLKAKKPSIGFQIAREVGALRLFPELEALIDLPQDPKWHPEGDVWTHTLMVVDEMAQLRTEDEAKGLILMLAALCHDFGKASTTQFLDGRWRSLGHEEAGVDPTLRFLDRLTSHKELIEAVAVLVKEHLKPSLFYTAHLKQKVSDAAIRRLAMRVNIEDLLILAKADCFGRTTEEALRREFPAGAWLSERAKGLQVYNQKPRPIVTGKDLMALGIAPGPEMGIVLKKLLDLQLEGAFSSLEGARNYLE